MKPHIEQGILYYSIHRFILKDYNPILIPYPYYTKNKQKNYIMKIKRFPRPIGLTMQVINYNKEIQQQDNNKVKGSIKQKFIQSITTQYITNGFILDGKPVSFNEYCQFVGITESEGYRYMARSSKSLGGLFGKDAIKEVSENILGLLLRSSLETKGRITYQYNILAKAQGEKFVPFLTKELNSTLGLMLNSDAGLANILKALAPTINQTNVQVNNPVTPTEEATYLTVDGAIALLAQTTDSTNIPALEQHYAKELPIIDAREQETVATESLKRPKRKERLEKQEREKRREREEGYVEILSE